VEAIETLRLGGSVFAAADEQAIHDYAIELLRDHHASEAAYQRILAAHGAAGIVQLTALIGYYAMVALTLNAHEIGVPDGEPPRRPCPATGRGSSNTACLHALSLA
jgi:4-carboxymuconolactone decarboxylase